MEAVLVLQAANGERLRRPLRIEPQRKWRVFVVHHSHLDIGYTDLQGTVLRHHRAYLDQALDLAALTDSWPDDAQFSWNIESLLPLERWLATRPEAAREELSERVDGRALRGLRAAVRHAHRGAVDRRAHAAAPCGRRPARRTHGYPIVTAMQTDVPGASLGLPRPWRPPASVTSRSRTTTPGAERRTSPAASSCRASSTGRSPAGERVLVWHTDSPHGVAYLEGNLLGLAESPLWPTSCCPSTSRRSRPAPIRTARSARHSASRPTRADPQAVSARRPASAGAGPARRQRAAQPRAGRSRARWNERWTYPQLRLACNADFFAEAEARLGSELETFTGRLDRLVGRRDRARARARTGSTAGHRRRCARDRP